MVVDENRMMESLQWKNKHAAFKESQMAENDRQHDVYIQENMAACFTLVSVHVTQNFSPTFYSRNTNRGSVRYPGDTGRKRVVKW